MSGFVNPGYDRRSCLAADGGRGGGIPPRAARIRADPGSRPSRPAAELGVGAVMLKDESDRFGLRRSRCSVRPGRSSERFGASSGIHTLVAASAGNHGRAVAHVAAIPRARLPGVPARTIVAGAGARRSPARAPRSSWSTAATRRPVAAATSAAAEPGVAAIADVGDSPQAGWVIDGYATLFGEAAEQAEFELLVVPVGVGSLAAAAARFAAPRGIQVVGVEPATAACLTASLAAGAPTPVSTPGTSMAGLDCSEISSTAWPSLRAGIVGDGHRRRRRRSRRDAPPRGRRARPRRLRRRASHGAPPARRRARS